MGFFINTLSGCRLAGVRHPCLLVALSVAACAGVALGCGWVGTEHAVRFNGRMSEREFGRLPRLPFSARGTKPPRADEEDDEDGEDSYAAREAKAREADAQWEEAEDAARRGDLAEARRHLRAYVDGTDGEKCGDYGSPVNCQPRRNSAFDRLDALAELERGAEASAVKAYLDARRAYDSLSGGAGAKAESTFQSANADAARAEEVEDGARGEPSATEDVRKALEQVPRGKGLDDNVAYLRAATLFREGELREAVRVFNRLAEQYPRSEKREAALFMAGLSSLKVSKSGLNGEHAAREPAGPDFRDEDWQRAASSLARLLDEYPRGRLAADARGWMAYLRLRVGDTAEGLAEYYRLLADETNKEGQAEALRSLALVRGAKDDEDMERLEVLIADEPRVALAYAYHSIYNYALRGQPYFDVPDERNPYSYYRDKYDSVYYHKYCEWKEKERARWQSNAERRELTRVAAFATRMLQRYPRAAVGGGFALRVAEADLELGEDRAAHELARRALALGVAGDERAAALWVKGVAEHRLKDFGAARQTLTALVAEYPNGDLTEGARRLLAMAAEDAGDLDAALEQYLALRYDEDVAYFVDVLMTPEQLAGFIERRSDTPAREMLLYSLGVRYLRLHRFDEARATYARVRAGAAKGHQEYFYGGPCAGAYGEPPLDKYKCLSPKEPDGEERGTVLARWVLRDVKTMEEIERLERLADLAASDEERSEALYQLGSYYYEASELTFYNPAAWRGGRFYALYYDYEMRAAGEAALLRRYMEDHEVLVRALGPYLRAAQLYPRTRAARDALYTAAVIHERLSGFLLYWPGQYQQGLHPGERMVTYADVKRIYPKYQLPRGTRGWEPSTRTVNGGPGWAAPPAQKPLTGAERLRRKIMRVEKLAATIWGLFGEVAGGRALCWTLAALRWTFVLLVSAAAILVFRLTRRSRAVLFELLARPPARRTKTAEALPAPISSYGAHEPYTPRARARAAARDVWRSLWVIVLDERGRAALALNLFAHGLLTALLYILMWTWRV